MNAAVLREPLRTSDCEHASTCSRPVRVAFAGGGTGGHIVPGLHVLAHVLASGRAADVADLVWFTSGRGVEERVFEDSAAEKFGAKLERIALPLEPRQGGAPTRGRLVLRTPASVLRARSALRRHQSEVLLGLGGFTTLPAVLAARSLGIPVALLEINSVRGAATRHLKPLAARVLHAWRATLPAGRESAKDRHLGPPLAPAFANFSAGESEGAAARRELGFAADLPLLLVLGGSQGSSALNAFVRAHAAHWVERGVQVLHQTGPGKRAEAAPEFDGYRVREYIPSMPDVLRAATLCVCRGGASTLAEIAAARVPAFVAPYPHHADHHQEINAAQLGLGARVFADERLDAGLRDEIVRLCTTAGSTDLERMRAALASAIPRDGAPRLWDELVHLAGAGPVSNPPSSWAKEHA